MSAEGIITAIVANPRHPGRFSLVVDGKDFATLGLDAIERLVLTVGASLAGKEAAVAQEHAALHTYDRALNMLAARARSSRELERLLVRKGEDAAHVRIAIDRLRQAGFLDDSAFARQLSRSRLLGAGHSPRRLRQELGRRGVNREAADDAVADVVADEGIEEASLARGVAAKKLRALQRLEPDVRKRRLYAFLARRGFSHSVIAPIVAEMTDAPGSRSEDES